MSGVSGSGGYGIKRVGDGVSGTGGLNRPRPGGVHGGPGGGYFPDDGGNSGGGGVHPNPRAGVQLRIRLRRIPGLTKKGVLRRPLRFPVVLGEEFALDEDAGWTDYLTVGAGELSSPLLGRRARMLKSFDTETMTLSWNPRWMTYHNQDPGDVRRKLQEVLYSQTPVQLLAIVGPSGHRPEFKGPVTLRTMTRRLRHGEADARYYALSFREYREKEVVRRRHGGKKGGGGRGNGRDHGDDFPRKHRLREGETLRDIAKKEYGDATKWRYIASANGFFKWGAETPLTRHRRFDVGDRLIIPRPHGPRSGGGSGYVEGD